jgi:hypothetical protein
MKISWRALHTLGLALIAGSTLLFSGCGGGGSGSTGSVEEEARARMEQERQQNKNAWEQVKAEQAKKK